MYNANYMDGVPVKIAEKYKPPPPIYNLPQSLISKFNLETNFFSTCPAFACDLQLEKKALSKIEQWKRIRQRNKEQRRERILKREERWKREDEDRQKNLLYCVSYPSTDDLSSSEEENVVVEVKDKGNRIDITETKEKSDGICVTEKISSFHNILQPTVLPFNSNSNPNSSITPTTNSTCDSKISNSFNYKDFEDDTSSPFDNIELKTINDLDVLAQVLHGTQIKSAIDENEVVSCDNTESKETCSSDREREPKIHTNSSATIPKLGISLPRFCCDLDSPQGASEHLRDNLISEPSIRYNDLNQSNVSYSFQSNPSFNKIDLVQTEICGGQTLDNQLTESKNGTDILKELRDEIRKSEIRRYKNCSYGMEDTIEHINVSLTKELAAKGSVNEDIFSQMDLKAKQLVQQISAMGFPLNRVVKIVQLVGNDDKKVVEHLIATSELLDLGFEEGKISDALLRNENNKTKALEDLIS